GMARVVAEFARNGWVNIVGGGCGTTPETIKMITEAVRDADPRRRLPRSTLSSYSGHEAFTITPDTNFVTVRDGTTNTGSKRFARLIRDGHYDEALTVARDQLEAGANIIDINMDEGLIDGVKAMTRFLNLIAAEPDIAKVPIMIDSSNFD